MTRRTGLLPKSGIDNGGRRLSSVTGATEIAHHGEGRGDFDQGVRFEPTEFSGDVSLSDDER
jgi:hypothetical protein